MRVTATCGLLTLEAMVSQIGYVFQALGKLEMKKMGASKEMELEQVELREIALMGMIVYLGLEIDKMKREWSGLCGSRTSQKGM